MSKPLTAAELLALRTRRVERVEIPEAGGHIYVRRLSVDEMDAFNAANVEVTVRRGQSQPRIAEHRTARFVALVACDEQGKRLFSEAEAAQLGQVDAAVMELIVDAGMRFNRLDEPAEDRLGNSSATRNGASATA
jgi:tartrate dehydratase beta subunit/fumarate hydratase class I family protein